MQKGERYKKMVKGEQEDENDGGEGGEVDGSEVGENGIEVGEGKRDGQTDLV